MNKPNPVKIGNERFKTWLKRLDPVARVHKMSEIARMQAASGLKGSMIKASLAQLSQRCNVMLIRLTDEEIIHYTRRKPVKEIGTLEKIENSHCFKELYNNKASSSAAQYSNNCDRNESRKRKYCSLNPSMNRDCLNSSKQLKQVKSDKATNARLEKRYKELFGDSDLNIDLRKEHTKTSFVLHKNTDCNNSSNVVSRTVNLNIFNSPITDINDNNPSNNTAYTENNTVSESRFFNNHLSINVSVAHQGSKSHKVRSRSRNKKPSKKQSKHAKQKLLVPSSGEKLNYENGAVKELWKIFGMESPTDRSENIRKSYPNPEDPKDTFISEEELLNVLSNSAQESDVVSCISPTSQPNLNFEGKSAVIENGGRHLDNNKLICETLKHFELIPTSSNSVMVDNSNATDDILVSNESASASSLECFKGNDSTNNVCSFPNIETISLSDDEDDEGPMKISSLENRQCGDTTKSKVGTIRVKSLRQLMDPEVAPETPQTETSSSHSMDNQNHEEEMSVEHRFFSLYKFFFDELMELTILKLGEILHLAIADDIRRNERIKRAEQLSSADLIHEEIQRAYKDFNDMMSIRSTDFSPLMDEILKQFEQSSKLTLFLILFIRMFECCKKIDPENGKRILSAANVIHKMLSNLDEHPEVLTVMCYNQEELMSRLKPITNLLKAYYHTFPLEDGANPDFEMVVPNLSSNNQSALTNSNSNEIRSKEINIAPLLVEGSSSSVLNSDYEASNINYSNTNTMNLSETFNLPNVSLVHSRTSQVSSTHNERVKSPIHIGRSQITGDVSLTQPQKPNSPTFVSSEMNQTASQAITSDLTPCLSGQINILTNKNQTNQNMDSLHDSIHSENKIAPLPKSGPTPIAFRESGSKRVKNPEITRLVANKSTIETNHVDGQQKKQLHEAHNDSNSILQRMLDPVTLSRVGQSVHINTTTLDNNSKTNSTKDFPTSNFATAGPTSVVQSCTSKEQNFVNTSLSNSLNSQQVNVIQRQSINSNPTGSTSTNQLSYTGGIPVAKESNCRSQVELTSSLSDGKLPESRGSCGKLPIVANKPPLMVPQQSTLHYLRHSPTHSNPTSPYPVLHQLLSNGTSGNYELNENQNVGGVRDSSPGMSNAYVRSVPPVVQKFNGGTSHHTVNAKPSMSPLVEDARKNSASRQLNHVTQPNSSLISRSSVDLNVMTSSGNSNANSAHQQSFTNITSTSTSVQNRMSPGVQIASVGSGLSTSNSSAVSSATAFCNDLSLPSTASSKPMIKSTHSMPAILLRNRDSNPVLKPPCSVGIQQELLQSVSPDSTHKSPDTSRIVPSPSHPSASANQDSPRTAFTPAQNENSEDDAVKELWKIFGMEPPTDRSENIIKSYPQSLDTTSTKTSIVDLPKEIREQRKEISTQPPMVTLGSKVPINETLVCNGSLDVVTCSSDGDVETQVYDSEPVCKIAETFSLVELNFDPLSDNVPNDRLKNEEVLNNDNKVQDCSNPTNEDTANTSHISSTEIETISLSDDDDEDSDAKKKNEKRNFESITANKIGTIRVKSLGQLLDPNIIPELSHPETPKSQSLNSLDTSPIIQTNVERSIGEVFMSTYKTHFDELLEAKILKLGDILHLAISDDLRRKGRIKSAKQLSSPDLIFEEIERAERDFMEMMNIRSLEFAPLVDLALKLFKDSYKLTMFFTLFLKVFDRAKEIDPGNKDQVLSAKKLFYMMISRLTEHPSVRKALLYKKDEFLSQLRKVSFLLKAVYKKQASSQNESSNSKVVNLPHPPLNSLTLMKSTVPRDDMCTNMPPETINANSESINRSATQISRAESLPLVYTHPKATASLQINSAQRNVSNVFEMTGPPNVSLFNSVGSGMRSSSLQPQRSNPLTYTKKRHPDFLKAPSSQPEQMCSNINISYILNNSSNQPLTSVTNSQWNKSANGKSNSKSYSHNLSYTNLNFPNNVGSLLRQNLSEKQSNMTVRNDLFDHRVGAIPTAGKSNEQLATGLKSNGGNLSPSCTNLVPTSSTAQRVSSELEQTAHKPASNQFTYALDQLLNAAKYLRPDSYNQPNPIASPPTTQVNVMERKSSEKGLTSSYKQFENSTPMTSVKNPTLSGDKPNESIKNIGKIAANQRINQHIYVSKPHSRSTLTIPRSDQIINPTIYHPTLADKLKESQPQVNDVNIPATTAIFSSKDNLASIRRISDENRYLTATKEQDLTAVKNVAMLNNCTMSSNNSVREDRRSVVTQNVGKNTPNKRTVYNHPKELDSRSYSSSTNLQSEIFFGKNISTVGSVMSGINTTSSAVATGLKVQDAQPSASKILSSSNHSVSHTLVPNWKTSPGQSSATSSPMSKRTIHYGYQEESHPSTSPSSITDNWISSRNVLPSPMKRNLGVNQPNRQDVSQPAVSPGEAS